MNWNDYINLKFKNDNIFAINKPKWTHILAEFYWIEESFWLTEDYLKEKMSLFVKQANLFELWNIFHSFWENSYTFVICLAESQFTLHSWPEDNYLTLDIFVCDYKKDNKEKAFDLFEKVAKFYNPKHIEKKIIYR